MTTLRTPATPEKVAIYVTASDRKRLLALLEGRRMYGREDRRELEALEEELDRAVVVDSMEVPPDVVTVGSRVHLVDLDSGEELLFTLVFPSRADADEGRISVLAPLGTAVLGYRTRDLIEWDVPGGRRRLRVLGVIDQPESAARRLRPEIGAAWGPRD